MIPTLGELTHIDLWGNYQIQSIHGNQYYILMIDNFSQHIPVNFLKNKNHVLQSIQDYLTFLSMHEHTPLAICVD
jgi:hypothetical protein